MNRSCILLMISDSGMNKDGAHMTNLGQNTMEVIRSLISFYPYTQH